MESHKNNSNSDNGKGREAPPARQPPRRSNGQAAGPNPIAAAAMSKSANEFAVDLFQCYLRRHGDKYINLLLCPYLIYHSLAMMLVGARGQTAQQLTSLLRLKPLEERADEQPAAAEGRRHRDFLMLTEQLIHGNHDFVHLASFIYLDKTVKRAERFKEILRDYYETKPKKMDLGDVEQTVRTINEDVARTTENIYSELLSKQEAAKLEKSMLLVSAVFFRGFWLSNFTDVARAPFTRSNQKDLRRASTSSATGAASAASQKCAANASQAPASATRSQAQPQVQQPQVQQPTPPPPPQTDSGQTVNMMSKLDYTAVLADEQLEARAIKMPFEASDLEMVLILPNDRHSNAAYLCERITATKVEQIVDGLNGAKQRSLRVSMPIFCVDSDKISIQSTLVTMGASDLFDRARANMGGVCENKPVWLNKILHRCFIVCDNRGSITSSSYERARKKHAASLKKDGSLSFRSLVGVDDFTADHPFMYIIVDSLTKTILLIGLYTDPSATLEVIHENQLSQEEAHQLYTEGFYKT